jgi:heat shock protein HslJ
MKKLKWIVPVLVLALFLAACNFQTSGTELPTVAEPQASATLAPEPAATSEPEVQPTSEQEVEAVEEVPEVSQPISRWNAVTEQGNWVLVAYGDMLNPSVVQPGTYVTINFNAVDGQVNGLAGCNNYFTSYTADDDGNLSINAPIGASRMACETGMEQEALYLSALETVSGYSLNESGELLIDYESGTVYEEQLVFIPESALVDTVWVLTAYGNQNDLTPTKPGVVTTAVFSANGTLNGNTGCNDYVATYTLQGNQMKVSLGSTTLAECVIGADQQGAFVRSLAAVQSYRLGINALELSSVDGSVLQFSAQHLPLENVHWRLAAVDGQVVPDGITTNALFIPAGSPDAQAGENTVSGTAGCNNFFGPYSLNQDKLTAGPFGVTKMMCDDTTMQVEQAFLSGLENANTYQVTLNQLTVKSSTGTLLFVADQLPLEGPRWILTGSGPVDNPQPPVEGGIFTASFERQFGMPSGIKSGSTGCRNYTATYATNFNQIKVNLPQASKGTCSDAQLETEQGYFLGLNAARNYQIEGNTLYIYFDNNVLIFVGDYPGGQVGPLTLLNGTEWQLVTIDAQKVILDTQITLLFEVNSDGRSGRISGSSGCNTYNAEINGYFSLGPVISTAVSCDEPEGVMKQEGEYLTVLQNASGVSLEGNTLKITTDQQTLYYTPKPPEAPEAVEPTPTPQAFAAVIIAPSNENVGQVITYDGSLSTPKGGIRSYSWWFSDGSIVEGVTVKRTYDKTGAYDAILTVTNNSGQKSEASIKTRIHAYLVGPVWVMDDSSITVKFDGNALSGFAGCNNYNASYTAETSPGSTNSISVGKISQNNKDCDDSVMESEEKYLENLKKVRSYVINFNSLTLTTSDGFIMVFYASQ